ncbi:hypothetical protein ACQP04_09360 [Pseudonocardia halophobica]|uniref:hypothetical protein n=1 Tax=Pseudonocardia halophobica TaxID=29401 RepID=UPI003D91AFEC
MAPVDPASRLRRAAGPVLGDLAAAFGGVKDSGIGRELGPKGLAAYRSLKSVYC